MPLNSTCMFLKCKDFSIQPFIPFMKMKQCDVVLKYEMPQRFVQAFHSMALKISVVPSQFHEIHEKLNN